MFAHGEDLVKVRQKDNGGGGLLSSGEIGETAGASNNSFGFAQKKEETVDEEGSDDKNESKRCPVISLSAGGKKDALSREADHHS